MKHKLLILSLVLICNVLYSQSYDEYECRGLFCNVKNHYNYTVELNSPLKKISALHFFLSKHKNSRFSDDAASNLAILEEARDWVIAKSENTIESYNQFIKSYPSHIYNQEGYESGSLERIILIKLIDFWFITDSINTISSYQEFIDNYPKNKCWICNEEFPYADTALMRISIIKDNDAWDEIKDEVTSIYFEEYLLNFPNGRYRNEAIQKIEDISIQPDWIKIKKKNSISSFRDFINQYPNSSYSQLAQEELVKIELSYWNKAQSRNSRTYYKRYLDNFPQGKYINEALKNLMDLEIAYQESKGKRYSSLGEKSQTRDYSLGSTDHSVTISNMTKHLGSKSAKTLYVSYQGTSLSKGYVSSSYTVSIDECEEITLSEGKYYFEVEVRGDNITSYKGEYDLLGEHSMRINLYVSGFFSLPVYVTGTEDWLDNFKDCNTGF